MTDPDAPRFNLLDDPWIPCRALGPDDKARYEELGIRALLERAHEITEVSSPSPLITISLYRLLLALMHRVYGPKDSAAWWALWEGRKADMTKLDPYLAQWRPRFELFDDGRPFYQDAAISEEYAGSIAELIPEQASDSNRMLLFDHGRGAAISGLTPAAAARYLVAFHSYAVGGFMSLEKGQDPKLYKSAKVGSLVSGAVMLVHGKTLWQTLLLNLVRYPREQHARASVRHDMPAWERPIDMATTALERFPDGYLDLLTWQSRRVRLFPDCEADGTIVVRRVAALKGHPFASDFERWSLETMMAFVQSSKKGSQDIFYSLAFDDERALWRDSTAIFVSTPGKTLRPQTLQWLDHLKVRRRLGLAVLPLDALGMRSDQANVLAWHHERLPLPLAYIDGGAHKEVLSETLGFALSLADGVGRAVRDSTIKLATLLIASNSGDKKDKTIRQPTSADVNGLVKSLGVERIFWAALDGPFTRFLLEVPRPLNERDDEEDEDNEDFALHAREQLDIWADDLRDASRRAFKTVTNGLDSSARALKAAALGESARRTFVAKALHPYGRRANSTSQNQASSDASAAVAAAITV